MQILQSRRTFLASVSAAGAAALLAQTGKGAAEPPPETDKVRLPRWIGTNPCWAGAYIAGELLRAEGFKVFYFQGDPNVDQSVWIARGENDFSLNFVPMDISLFEEGVPIKTLAGLHSGCLELIANQNFNRLTDLKGKRVGVWVLGSSTHKLLTLMFSYVGMDPAKDIEWVETGYISAVQLLAEGKIDAFLAGPPHTQRMRSGNLKYNTLLNTTLDPPWSQHFCCMVSARADYVNNYPIATKRVLRAILKSADLCASNPQLAARQMVDQEFFPSYDLALQTLRDIRYDRWRDYDPEDSVRFYALRMQETGMIKTSPQKIIADATDWRFLNELKRELKT
ncbi:MAG TPA: ABC transporter substrate-binding protein [Aestuariivirgaceae bacterium]|jgi:NitT/TauT family transport system substrate-binding protein